MLPDVAGDEGAPRHDAQPFRAGVVQGLPRQAAADAMALVGRIDLGVEEDDPSGGQVVERGAGDRAVDQRFVAPLVRLVDNGDGRPDEAYSHNAAQQ